MTTTLFPEGKENAAVALSFAILFVYFEILCQFDRHRGITVVLNYKLFDIQM